MRKHLFILCLLCLIDLPARVMAQPVNIDSLKEVCHSKPLAENTLRACFEIAESQQYVNADTTERYFHLAIENATRINPDLKVQFLAGYANFLMYTKRQFHKADSLLQLGIDLETQRSNRPKQLLNLYKLQGLVNGNLGEVAKGKSSRDKAASLLEEHDFSNYEKGEFYNDFAVFYSFSGDLEQFTATMLTAIDFFEKDGDVNNNVAMGYLNLAITHIKSKQYEKAKKFGEKVLKILEASDNEFLLGHNYAILMVVNSELNKPTEAVEYAQKSLKIWQKLEILSEEAGIRRNLATLHRKAKKYKAAIEEINLSIVQFNQLENPGQLIYCWAEKALIHAHNKDRQASQAAIDSLFKLKYVFANNAVEWMNILASIEEVHAKNNNYRAAYTIQKEHQALKDSVINAENLIKIEELETQYFTKEKDIALQYQKDQLQQQKYLIWLFGLLILSLLVLAFIFWKNAQYRKSLNTQLRQLDKAKSRFFTNISHELRTPLTLILAPLEDALEKVTSKSIKSNLQLAHSNSKRLLTLVNEIMDLSKLESGKMHSNESILDLEKLLRRIFYSYHSFAQLKGFILSFSYHLPKDIGLMVDAEKLEKVLNNLLSNAFKYSHTGGAITLRVSDEHFSKIKTENLTKKISSLNGFGSKMLKIEVSDTGKGIPPTELDKIFDRYYQVEDENEPLRGGTGIGLAYAKESIRFLGGDLLVESELGSGTNFIIYLPFKKSKLNALVQEEETSFDGSQLDTTFSPDVQFLNNRPKILIVEDNPEMSKFLEKTLSSHFNCTTALNGNIALELLKDQNFDLITSDIMMPNMDGFEFLKQLKLIEKLRYTPTIMLTARAMEDDKLRGLSLGIDDYLTKPFSVKELLARIQNLLKNKSAREAFSAEKVGEDNAQVELSFEQKQLKTAESIVNENIDNIQFKVEDLAHQMNYSRRQIERIIKKLTGLTPGGFIREIRLQKARQLLENRQFATIAEVRYEVGMENASHFSKIFQERFGIKPSEVE